MSEVKFTSNLKRFFPALESFETNADSILEITKQAESRYPGICNYLLTDSGALREHVNIYLNDSLITDRQSLSDKIREDDRIYIMQAISGG